MLKIWKNAWKKEDGSRKSRLGENNSGTGNRQDGFISTASELDQATVAPSSLACSDTPIAKNHEMGDKRARSEKESDNLVDRPPKKLKTATNSSAHPGDREVALVLDNSTCINNRPAERVILYESSSEYFKDKPQLSKAFDVVGDLPSSLISCIQDARDVFSEVGPCASDLLWRRLFRQNEKSWQVGSHPSVFENSIMEVVRNWPFAMPNLDLDSKEWNVTPKFYRLVQVLESCKPLQKGFRGIVFVRKQVIANALYDLLRCIDNDDNFIRPVLLYDNENSTDEVVHAFRDGAFNILIAAVSGGNAPIIPPASCVICFDLFEGNLMNEYVLATARRQEGHIIYLAEKENEMHRRLISQNQQIAIETAALADVSRASPPAPKLIKPTSPMDFSGRDDDTCFIVDPATSQRITIHDAVNAIEKFAFSKAGGGKHFSTLTEVQRDDRNIPKYICSVLLPGTPVHGFVGPPRASELQAKRAVCFGACLRLYEIGYLDYNFFPTCFETPSQKDNSSKISASALELRKDGSRCFPRKSPDFWPNSACEDAKTLWPTMISVDHPDNLAQPHGSILMLTRKRLPPLLGFKVFCSGVAAQVYFKRGAKISFDQEQVHLLHLYTTRVCRTLGNKSFLCVLDRMPYFFAPLDSSHAKLDGGLWDFPNFANSIPWPLVRKAANHWMMAIESLDNDALEDTVIQDRWVEFTRRYYLVRVRRDLSPLSKPMDSIREASFENVLEYCKAKRKGFEDLKDHNQPLFEVSKVPLASNNLNPTPQPVNESTKFPVKYLIPELCHKFTIPASTLRTALLLPSITKRIDDILIVKELSSRFFDHSISEDFLHVATTSPSAGYEFDYERLEILGDTFLKYLSSIYSFVTCPTQSEGSLHKLRQSMVSNKALHTFAANAGLPKYIQSKMFMIKGWQPPGFFVLLTAPSNAPTYQIPTSFIPSETIQNELSAVDQPQTSRRGRTKTQRIQDSQGLQYLGDKAIADVAEAIIGAGYISGGRDVALKAAKSLGFPLPGINSWSDFKLRNLNAPMDVMGRLRAGAIEAVESIIGCRFRHPNLLALALVHSYVRATDTVWYERFEFIGDAILDLMAMRHIFYRDTKLTPEGLTLLKGAMVGNRTLATICVLSGIQQHLIFETYQYNIVQAYAKKIRAKYDEERILAKKENRSPGQFWIEIEPPKVLSDVVESIIGALYISDNLSFSGPETLFKKLLRPFYDQHITLRTLSPHPITSLYQFFQAYGCHQFQLAKARTDDGFSCEVLVHDVLLADALDPSSTTATRRAALSALDALDRDDKFLARTCDCS